MAKKSVSTQPVALSQTETELIVDFLSAAADEFSEHTCNDFTIPATEDNKAIASAIIRHIVEQGEWGQEDSPDEYVSGIMTAEGSICTFDNWIAGYFSHRCKSLSGKPLSAAELMVVTMMLEFSADEHANLSNDGDGEFDFTLEATAENKDFLSAVVKHHGAPTWKADIKQIKASDEECTLQDFWVMRYLADRCKNLATAPATEEPRAASANSDGPGNTPPSIERTGIAPRFPRIKAYLKAYFVSWANWETKELAHLRKYASEGAGFIYDKKFDLTDMTYEIVSVLSDMEHCAKRLQWHAIQAALGADVVKMAVEEINAAAALREFKADMRSKDYFRALHYADCIRDNVEDQKLLSQGRVPLEVYDSELSKMDWLIATALAERGFAKHDIEKAIVACSPQLQARKQDLQNEYAQQTVARAFHNSYVQTLIEDNAMAQQSLESFSKSFGTHWQAPWQRAVALSYWKLLWRASAHPNAKRPSIGSAVVVAKCLILGWQDWALDIAERIHLERDYDKPRTEYFVLRLIDDWQGRDPALRPYPKHAVDEPLFNALIEHWRTPNPADIAPLLMAACDRHTFHASRTGKDTEFKYEVSSWYYPYEILAVLKLRQLHGLENPVLDHPLMDTPLGKLPEPAPKYTDALIEGVVAQLRANAVPS